MKTCTEIGALKRERRPVVLAAGFFDGLHLGHRRVIARARREAAERGGTAWVLTFDRHPLSLLAPREAPPLLTSLPHRLLLLERLGADGCLVLSFSRELAEQPPVAFIRQLRDGIPALSSMLVGRNWHFGRNGEGDARLLRRLGRDLRFDVRVATPVIRAAHPVSSTRIRDAVASGRLADAADMLGRPFSILGRVVHGRAMGRRLGAPTANLQTENEVLPPAGVYAAHALVPLTEGGADAPPLYDAVCNLGTRPTFEDDASGAPVPEVHVMEACGSLYGRQMELFFVGKLRDEKRFDSLEELRAQIARDRARTRAILPRRSARKKIKESLYTPPPPVYSLPRQQQKRKRKE